MPSWLSLSASDLRILQLLGERLKADHHDRWLLDLVQGNSSPEAYESLRKAIIANVKGDAPAALAHAALATIAFERKRNVAGVIRSGLETIYALRRQSKGQPCVDEYAHLQPLIRGDNYPWLSSRIMLEASGCLGMVNEFDKAWHLAAEARDQATRARYPVLQLRSLGYLGSFHTVEGRVREAWETDQEGLEVYWKDEFSGDRGYQFYADLEFDAEQARSWRVALALQTEAISQIQGTARADFTGIAYCRRARLHAMLHETAAAQNDMEQSRRFFNQLPPESTLVSRCDCEVSWAAVDINQGATQAALRRLHDLGDISQYDNFTLQLRYEKTWADLERARLNTAAEIRHLQQMIAIGNKGLSRLKQPGEQWEWHRLMEESYRRLLAYTLQQPHSPFQTFTQWESFRDLHPAGITTRAPNKEALLKLLLKDRIRELHRSTVITFAVFPSWIQIWIADDRGLKEFRTVIDTDALQRQVQEFHDLCAGKENPVQKVNAAGARLYSLLMGSIEQYLYQKRTLFIEADQFLNLVPWPALVKTDGSYLGQSYAIVNTPGLLYREHSRPSGKNTEKRMLVVYPGSVQYEHVEYLPLPQAQDEAEFVVEKYPASRYLKDLDATATHILQGLQTASRFHFAGHATTREHNGELIVHGDTKGEVISASRVRHLSLRRMQLVVLSACQTGAGTDPTRDPNGLVKAFLDAGTKQVIASMWDVDSGQTATLMRSFYTSLATGQSNEHALEDASTSLIAGPTDSHPYYWAAFQIFGAVN